MESATVTTKGLKSEEVLYSRKTYGSNALHYKKEHPFWLAIKQLVTEPMVILLLVAATIYFVLGDVGDGIFLAAAILLVSAISLFQDSRSKQALEKLKTVSQPLCVVIRDGAHSQIPLEEVVVGDFLQMEEGSVVAADGRIYQSNDFSVNESLLTGESLPVYKDKNSPDAMVYRGSSVVSGLAIAEVTSVGNQTKLGRIGKDLSLIKEVPSPLEIQINGFVKRMTAVGIVVFVLVWFLNYINTQSIVQSLLRALTLAMSILPEEIPVAFTTFLALGAWRLMKMGIVVKQMKTVETLGSATVICADKTGTITKNEMSLAQLFVLESDTHSDPGEGLAAKERELVRTAMWASEPIPFDPMEVALHMAYEKNCTKDERPLFHMRHEYPLGGKPPMMTHIFEDGIGTRIVAAKGAPEAFLKISDLSDAERTGVHNAIRKMAIKGYRILAIAEGKVQGSQFPETQQEIRFKIKGLIAFYDPPKEHISEVFQNFNKAGIQVKIITGDNEITTKAIAEQIHFEGSDHMADGMEMMALAPEVFQKRVMDTRIFTRMFPEAKLRVIEALQSGGEVVAMTGDGINDAPALKAANIGVAMGKKGTEIAKAAADLILIDDDLSKMVDAVGMGRKIYTNLKKAIQYVISIHIPIILIVFIPLAMGWIYPNIFTPVHVILLELIMGPTCSIIYENEPMEQYTMLQKPRPFRTTFFKWKELLTSIVQGLMITVGALIVYWYAVGNGYSESLTRTMVFTTIISSNVFLTLINRSFYFSVMTTLHYKNPLVGGIIFATLALTAILIYIPTFSSFFMFEPLSLQQLGISMLAGFAFVGWYEVVKWYKRFRLPAQTSLK